jgi:ABC-type ATPase involved in cell division
LDESSYDGLVSFLRSFAAADKTVLVATHDDAFVEALGARRIPLVP